MTKKRSLAPQASASANSAIPTCNVEDSTLLLRHCARENFEKVGRAGRERAAGGHGGTGCRRGIACAAAPPARRRGGGVRWDAGETPAARHSGFGFRPSARASGCGFLPSAQSGCESCPSPGFRSPSPGRWHIPGSVFGRRCVPGAGFGRRYNPGSAFGHLRSIFTPEWTKAEPEIPRRPKREPVLLRTARTHGPMPSQTTKGA